MEPLKLHGELVTKFSNSIHILKYYGYYREGRLLMMILCKRTNQLWKQCKIAYDNGLIEGMKSVLHGNLFLEMHKRFLLENDRYKYCKIDAPLFADDNSGLKSFIRDAPHPELIDLASTHNKASGYKIYNFIHRLIQENKACDLNSNFSFTFAKVKSSESKIVPKEYIKRVLSDQKAQIYYSQFILCHSRMTYTQAATHFDTLKGKPMNSKVLSEVKEFTLGRVNSESNSKPGHLSSLSNFLCNSLPKLEQFNIEFEGHDQLLFQGMKEVLDKSGYEESLQFDFRSNQRFRDFLPGVKSRNAVFMYFSKTEQYIFRADTVKLYFKLHHTNEISQNGNYIIMKNPFAFKFK